MANDLKSEVTLHWNLEGDFKARHYSRAFMAILNEGSTHELRIECSASPDVVPLPFINPNGMDPEEAYLFSIASCHMLWFLDYAAQAGLELNSYQDQAYAIMSRLERGRFWISKAVLRPRLGFAGEAASDALLADIHKQAHHACFIANSVKTEIVLDI